EREQVSQHRCAARRVHGAGQAEPIARGASTPARGCSAGRRFDVSCRGAPARASEEAAVAVLRAGDVWLAIERAAIAQLAIGFVDAPVAAEVRRGADRRAAVLRTVDGVVVVAAEVALLRPADDPVAA